MLNPFIQSPSAEKHRHVTSEIEDALVQRPGSALRTAIHPSAGLWLGKLLIRIGQKLVGQDVPLKSRRENA